MKSLRKLTWQYCKKCSCQCLKIRCVLWPWLFINGNEHHLSGFEGGCTVGVAGFVKLKGAFMADILLKILQLQQCLSCYSGPFQIHTTRLGLQADVVVLVSHFSLFHWPFWSTLIKVPFFCSHRWLCLAYLLRTISLFLCTKALPSFP